MTNGAYSFHKQLRTNLENYIRSQYFGKSPLLLSALSPHLDDEGLFYQKPFIESSPAYITVPNGLAESSLEPWMKDYFRKLAESGLGIFSSPFKHQISALEAAIRGENLFVATGTGSGKTECFMWPLLAKMAEEARNSGDSWSKRGVRTIIMYPMNALVSDQISRLRKMLGDPEGNFLRIFRETCGSNARRPQFGMYTGRTPYPGEQSSSQQDQKLEKTLSRISCPQTDADKEFFRHLLKEGKIPAKVNMEKFLAELHAGRHTTDPEDAELITRFEMQKSCPDILITNYSMLEYMMIRPREKKIWDDTRQWLHADKRNKLLFVIDEAHMYRGSSGGEVSLMIRRLFHKLGIRRDRVQFILTTASMPDNTPEDRNAVMEFASALTASDIKTEFRYLTGEREHIDKSWKYDISFSHLQYSDPCLFEGKEEERISALLSFWKQLDGFDPSLCPPESIYSWMYSHILLYRPFRELIRCCRGNAVSLDELAESIFPDFPHEKALHAVSVLLSIAPLAKDSKGSVLFPARMHMLFKGISAVYACTNAHCSHSHSAGGLTLGEVFLSDGHLTCPYCGSVVYELYNDRRCGALFFKGYIKEEQKEPHGTRFLWQYPGQLMDKSMKEIHLFIPDKDFILPKGQRQNPVRPCYLDVKNGFINFTDDSWAAREDVRKLYFCGYFAKGRPDIFTFPSCPHCRHQLSETQLTSFGTRGNQSFFALIKAQFMLQPAVPGKDNNPEQFPNEGRKVLLFSDSRQRAAKLARDMSYASDISAARQLFALALQNMEKAQSETSLNFLYDYFCLSAAQHHVHLSSSDREKFAKDCSNVLKRYKLSSKRGRIYSPTLTLSEHAPASVKKYFLQLFAGGYNTLYDSAASWIEPINSALYDSEDSLEEYGISVSDEDFLELFNAWIMSICDTATALGHTIPDDIRLEVRPNYGRYGLSGDWKFPKVIRDIMGWKGKEESETELNWKRVLTDNFLEAAAFNNGRQYIDLSRVRARFQLKHEWYRCEQCSELTPFLLKNKCPSCGSSHIHKMTPDEYEALSFRKPILDALNHAPIRIIDTEEHTAQLSHKDQRDALWSKTEEYELRFRDLVRDGESPVDILSSTTTMEVGIDIGSLVAVGLRNIPPMRENYQQRAGRAGRRGAGLSTIVTFCENGPHDILYFNNPVPMLRGDPRRPWIDVKSEKLLQRHMAMVIFQEFLAENHTSLDTIPAADFLFDDLNQFLAALAIRSFDQDEILLPTHASFSPSRFKGELQNALQAMKEKCKAHPELFGAEDGADENKKKSLLDALYEEGLIPTYSFPKNVVSTYISGDNGQIVYTVERGLDVAIGEYAPGRAIVVDKQTYQIGGFYYPGSERIRGHAATPARAYIDDPNYVKNIVVCESCGWFGLKEEHHKCCPFCGNETLSDAPPMLRPWGFAPKNARSIPDAQLSERYTAVQQPLYSTLPEADEMKPIPNCRNIRIASRTNQRIIMMNTGINQKGFRVCRDCGAAMPIDDPGIDCLKDVGRPYQTKYAKSKCRHEDCINVNLGYDFITDMLVLEFKLDNREIDTSREKNLWLPRAAQSLAEALRLAASKRLDIEFTELVTGYRLRTGKDFSYVDIYLYDSLSSGAGYAAGAAAMIEELLTDAKVLLNSCNCEAACTKCLKHYRNQHVHGLLDRFAALQLLAWGTERKKELPIPLQTQIRMLQPLENILRQDGCEITVHDGLQITYHGITKDVVIYPAMWAKPYKPNTIFISDAYIKYAKPYVISQILGKN